MRIGEIARAAGTTVRLLRHYESQGLIQSHRLPNGYRDYASETVDKVRWVRELLDCGFSTRQIQGFMHCYAAERMDVGECEAGLAQHREKLRELDTLLAVLGERRTRLAERMEQLFATPVS